MSVQNYKYTILSPLLQRYKVTVLITALCSISWPRYCQLGHTIFCENHMHIIFVTPKTNSCLCAKKVLNHCFVLNWCLTRICKQSLPLAKYTVSNIVFFTVICWCETYCFYVEIFGRERRVTNQQRCFLTFDNVYEIAVCWTSYVIRMHDLCDA